VGIVGELLQPFVSHDLQRATARQRDQELLLVLPGASVGRIVVAVDRPPVPLRIRALLVAVRLAASPA
jgi:hypothetical protein